MNVEPTLEQSGDDRRAARELSERRTRPPCEVPGYLCERFLGAGAYGEVWVALDRNTGRRVAIKFYSHRGGVDWSLLSREVEKLAFLFNDRYVVQLLDVGWDAEPPFYVMEYLPQGSVEDRLAKGPIPEAEAVPLFRDVATGLSHAHGRGVLHCDLKPANILLDHEGKPRIADFGQSRLSHEQTPALGTLFYMAPEQADAQAVPDARWDVYALGAVLFAMLVGRPPYRSATASERLGSSTDLDARLAEYRRILHESPRPTEHRRVPGVDRALAELIDRCLAITPARRFPNVQSVLDALDRRRVRRARRPLVLLGALGPLLLLSVMALVGWLHFNAVMRQSDEALRREALENNRFAARFVAANMGNALERRLRAVEEAAADPRLAQLLVEAARDAEFTRLTEQLNRPADSPEEEAAAAVTREAFRRHPRVRPVEQWLARFADEHRDVTAASWFVSDAAGLHWARQPWKESVGKNYAWRTYFHGGPRDFEEHRRGLPPLAQPQLSAAFRSDSTGQLILAASAPVVRDGQVIAVVALTVQIGRFAELESNAARDPEEQQRRDRFAVLVDERPGPNRGMILQHRLHDELLAAGQSEVPPRLDGLRVILDPNQRTNSDYHDVLARDRLGQQYDRRWLAAFEPVPLRGRDSGLWVIVQQSYDEAIGRTLVELRRSLLGFGALALALAAAVMTGLWAVVIGALNDAPRMRWARALRRRLGLSSERTGSASPPTPAESAGSSNSAESSAEPAATEAWKRT